jgi:hypothetical protein
MEQHIQVFHIEQKDKIINLTMLLNQNQQSQLRKILFVLT